MSAPTTPPVPRPSTTVLLVRDAPGGLEVLMVTRHEKTHFSSAMVFPGGVIDPEDADEAWLDLTEGGEGLDVEERARCIAGFRELYEETGILLLGPDGQSEATSSAEPFRDLVQRSGARLDLGAMAPFANWITPERAPKRFDVHFRLCWTRTEVEPVHDGREVVAAEWLRPDEAIALGDAGERVLLLPTRCQLELLGKSRTVEEAVAEARSRKISALTPQFERRPEGLFALLPADSGYPILERPIPRGGA